MSNPSLSARILFITPEVIFCPGNKDSAKKICSIRRGKKIGFFTNLLNDLYHLGYDIHIAQPEYRKVFSSLSTREDILECSDIPESRLHMARDRVFHYACDIDVNDEWDNIQISLAFQREIIHHLIPMIQPDIIHCHDWMTGLIPAAAGQVDKPCLFTVYDVRSKKISLWQAEDIGIDTAYFWESLFYDRMPENYEETRATNSVDLLLSGIFAADYVNAASMSFASEILSCQSNRGYYGTAFSQLLAEKCKNGSVASYNYGIAGKAQEYIGLYQVLLDNSHPD